MQHKFSYNENSYKFYKLPLHLSFQAKYTAGQ